MTLLQEAPPSTATRLAPALLGISHGTSSPAGQAAVAGLVAAVAAVRADLEVAGGFVDVQAPDVPTVLSALEPHRAGIVVPLLLSAGFHVRVDLRRELDAVADRRTALARALGPDDRLVAVLVLRLREAGLRPSDRLVLGCAGSTDERAVADCHEMGARLARALGTEVRVGFISAAQPRLPVAVATERVRHPGSRVVVSTYLLAPGYFADLASTAGADRVTAPLLVAGGPPPAELVDLVVDRYAEAVALEGLS